MAVGILEISGISAPEGLLSGLHQVSSGGNGLAHDRIDLAFTPDIMTDREFGGAAAGLCDPGIVGDVAARKERELDSVLQVKEHDRPMLELRADNAFGGKTEAVAVEFQRCVE